MRFLKASSSTAMFIIFCFTSAHALCVKTNTANLRSKPTSNAEVTWVAPLYTPLVELKRTGNWIQVEDMGGEVHWVYGTNVTSKITCVSVKTNTAKLRKAPKFNAELSDIRQVDKYTPFKRIDASNDWYEVQAAWGETYWVHESTVWRPLKVAKINF